VLRESQLETLRERRARQPGFVHDALVGRQTRPLLGQDGRLLIVAADHPARGALGVGANEMAMSSRPQLLDRLMQALDRDGVDGVLATADILEDLAALGALDGRLAIGSVNRGGLKDSIFELDDRVTGFDVDGAVAAKLDAIKCLLRIDRDDHGTVATLERLAIVLNDAALHSLPVFLEPFMSSRMDGRVRHELTPEAVVRALSIAQAIGATSAWTWLKLPVVANMAAVADSTTMPIVLLGGDSSRDPLPIYEEWSQALRLPGVRGMMVGRSVLYPHDGDVVAAVDRVVDLVRG
jgi:DhnA family fructose-bisphosphate aldolase class Ia